MSLLIDQLGEGTIDTSYTISGAFWWGVACIHGAFCAPSADQWEMTLLSEGWAYSSFSTAPYFLNYSLVYAYLSKWHAPCSVTGNVSIQAWSTTLPNWVIFLSYPVFTHHFLISSYHIIIWNFTYNDVSYHIIVIVIRYLCVAAIHLCNREIVFLNELLLSLICSLHLSYYRFSLRIMLAERIISSLFLVSVMISSVMIACLIKFWKMATQWGCNN